MPSLNGLTNLTLPNHTTDTDDFFFQHTFLFTTMATRSRIGIQLADDSILSVYHHWDGYPEWLGRILNTHYNTKEKVADLIDGGDMSCCWTKDRWTGKQVAAYVNENIEAAEYGPQYYAQRGEDCPPRYDESIFDFLDKDNNEEYAYVWTVNNKWVAFDMNEFNDKDPEKVEIPDGALAV